MDKINKSISDLTPTPCEKFHITINEKNKCNILANIKNIMYKGDLGKIAFCGLSVYTLWSNNNILKLGLSAIVLRKLYKIYQNNMDEINDILDSML